MILIFCDFCTLWKLHILFNVTNVQSGILALFCAMCEMTYYCFFVLDRKEISLWKLHILFNVTNVQSGILALFCAMCEMTYYCFFRA